MSTILCVLSMFAIVAATAAWCWHKFILNWRDTRFILRGSFELFRGFRVMNEAKNLVTAFGSARLKEDSAAYLRLHAFLLRLVERSKEVLHDAITIVTGGGPGAMEAGNRAGHDAGVPTIGLNILLPFEQSHNRFCSIVINFWYFFARKICLVRFSKAFVIGDGGFGTDDELFEVLTLQQTGKSPTTPIYIVDENFAQQILIKCVGLLKRGLISGADLERITLVNCPNVPDLEVPCCDAGEIRVVKMRRLHTDEEAIEEIVNLLLCDERGTAVDAAAPIQAHA